MLNRWLHIVKKIIILTWRIFEDHMHLIKSIIHMSQNQKVHCSSSNFWSFKCSCEDVLIMMKWMNILESESVLILIFKSLVRNWIKEWRACINVDHKRMILRYYLTYDDDKVDNKMILNELKCLLLNHKHRALLEQKCFMMIMTSESYSTWVKKIICKNEFDRKFDHEIKIVINVRTESTLYNLNYEKSFIIWSFFYQNEFNRDYKMMIESFKIMLKLLKDKQLNTWFLLRTLMSWKSDDLMKLIVCLKRQAWNKDSKLIHCIINALMILKIKYKKLKKRNEQIVEMKICA